MKKKILVGALTIAAGIGISAGTSFASLTSYWSLADLTAGSDGTSSFSVTFETAANDNFSFGIFNTSDSSTLDQLITIFDPNEYDYTATANFIWDGSDYDVTVTVKDGLGAIVETNDYYDFGDTFGFYFVRELATDTREIFSDSQFDYNAGLNTMVTVADTNLDEASVQLWYDGNVKYAVMVTDVSPIPEPTTMLLFGAGLVGLAGLGRKKK